MERRGPAIRPCAFSAIKTTGIWKKTLSVRRFGRRRCDGMRPAVRSAGPSDEHPLYHDRRPYGANDELLRYALRFDAQSRPHRRRGRAFHQQFRRQFLERSQPRLYAYGQAFPQNGFYDNTTCVFDNTQQTFPKLLQQAGYETAVVGKWHLESLPTGFDHWEIVPGQGDYYNPDFIRQTGDTVRSEGYITNLITDKSLDWLRSGRDPEKPFCLLVHHKAQHRNWMADTCNLALYEELDFPLPDTFSMITRGVRPPQRRR